MSTDRLLQGVLNELAYQRRFTATQLHVYRSTAVGDNLGGGIGGMAPGFLIGGIVVDNPSGSWVHLISSDQYIPPYTFGWASVILPGQQTISAEYVDGPIGQPSTQAGLPAVFYLYDGGIQNSPGSPFIETQSPTIAQETVIAVPAIAGIPAGTVYIAGTANRRIRLFDIIATQGAVAAATADVMCRWILSDSVTGLRVISGMLSPRSPVNPFSYPGGQDLEVGANLTIESNTAPWAGGPGGGINASFTLLTRYQLI